MNDETFYIEDGFAVKTLFVKYLTRDLMGDQIFDYFSTFGRLLSVRVHSHAASPFGFVEFEGVEAAARVLNMKHHVIDGHEIEVEIANIFRQDEPYANDELRMESTNATVTEFMDLNDDCIREILIRVSEMDLCSLLEVSKTSTNIRLKAITNEIFSLKHKSVFKFRNEATLNDMERLLANFGSLIRELSVSSSSWNEDTTLSRRILKSIIQNCSGTLEELSLSMFAIGEKETSDLKVLFGKLKCLNIVYCRVEGAAADLFATCKSLITLNVTDKRKGTKAIFQQTFPDLESFSYNGSFDLKAFISRHKKLKSIRLEGGQEFSDLLPVLARNCSELKDLNISTDGTKNPDKYETSVKSISALKNLDKLRIYRDGNAIKFIQALSSLQSLRELTLASVRYVPGLETVLSQLKMLKKLTLDYCKNFTNFLPLAELGRLKELFIFADDGVTLDLMYMLNRLDDLERLSFYTFGHTNNLNTFDYDERMASQIVDALSKSGSAKRTLEIACNGQRTLYCSQSMIRTKNVPQLSYISSNIRA